MTEINIDLREASLFGNSASEDEENEIFSSYAIRREEVNRFVSNEKICIIKTLKGCGKSAILRIAKNELDKKGNITILVNLGDISQSYESSTPDAWVIKWKESIYLRVAEELGSLNSVPLDNYENDIKKLAFKAGSRNQNFIDSLKKFFHSINITAEMEGCSTSIGFKECDTVNQKALPHIISKNLNKDVYIFIDDIDHNFVNTKETKASLVGFLTACRYISNETPNIKFRLTLRPNSWKLIKVEYPSVNSHLAQYVIDMYWPHGEIKKLIQKRISGYLYRTFGKSINENKILELVFDEVFWDGNRCEATQPIATYSKRRPRWAKDIFRLAASRAANSGRKKISLEDINEASKQIGDTIIDEITAEFNCECNLIGSFIRSFMGQKNSYTTDELLHVINNRILNHIGSEYRLSSKDIAHLLFYCGFLYARENYTSGQYKNYYFEEKPYLFTDYNDEHTKYKWEIDLIFRNVLQITDTKPQKSKRQYAHY